MKQAKKILLYIAAIIFVIIFVIQISPKAMQNDTFWSIKVGEKILNEGFYKIDDFSVHEGLKYIAQHYLTDILIYIMYMYFGIVGLYVLEVTLAIIIFSLLYKLNIDISKNKILSFIFTFFQMFMFSAFISVRAQVISYMFFILELILLEKFDETNQNKYLAFLSVIPIFIANFHMGVAPLYFVFLGVYIVWNIKFNVLKFEAKESVNWVNIKKLSFVFLLGLATLFINPYFFEGVMYPYKTLGNSFINSAIVEFQPFNIMFDNGKTLVLIVFLILVFITTNKKIKLKDALLIFGTLFMSLVAVRYVSFAVICSSFILRYILLPTNMPKLEKNEVRFFTCVYFIIIVIFVGQIINNNQEYLPKAMYPVEAIDNIKDNIDENTIIFNEYSWGSYLMLNDIKVFIDSRCDLYTKEYNFVTIAEDYGKLMKCDNEYKEIIKKYGINMFVIGAKCQLATLLNENESLTKIYSDETTVIYKSI